MLCPQHVVFSIGRILDLLVPDIPESVEVKVKREYYLAKQALAENEVSPSAPCPPFPSLPAAWGLGPCRVVGPVPTPPPFPGDRLSLGQTEQRMATPWAQRGVWTHSLHCQESVRPHWSLLSKPRGSPQASSPTWR